MKCAVHTDVDATGYCGQCGKPLCPACTRDVHGALYCEPCLASMVGSRQGAPNRAAGGTHPGTALALGFIPGLGAVYNGEYVKALIHVVIFGGIIALLNTDLSGATCAFLGIGLGCFYLYMPIEAYRIAKARQARRTAASQPRGNRRQEAGWCNRADRARRSIPYGKLRAVAEGVVLQDLAFGTDCTRSMDSDGPHETKLKGRMSMTDDTKSQSTGPHWRGHGLMGPVMLIHDRRAIPDRGIHALQFRGALAHIADRRGRRDPRAIDGPSLGRRGFVKKS